MNNNYFFALGLMSGTSLDGIDIVYVKFKRNDYSFFEILQAETIPYSIEWKQQLQNAIHFSSDELKKLDISYGKYLASLINNFVFNYKIEELAFVASHGHTILHEPDKGITLQVGSGNEIAKLTKQKVVCDFRTQDVKLGGQGAPLVPIGDELLFSNIDYCLNLGGFSNVSYHNKVSRIAFDICPVNIVLNLYANKLGLEYDASGEIASKGTINKVLLEKLNQLEFYQKNPPKSLGLEWVQQQILPLIDSLEKDVSNVLRTFVEHVAMQISSVLEGSKSVLITGGGVFNVFLIDRIKCYTNVKIVKASNSLINYKEALIFAFLGVLKIDNQVNCLKSVTGASKNHSSGVVFLP
ncbi:anhydro-N-acetylmuramic acid kinase [Polaribacter sp. KT 15]|uniref:anhydro-N-acetylmuramic acid kinase n=1 Tax=Polaribacter sp. KT 15 TaxID=1896175 RepID=UPI00090B7D04|nr:anhydro-N-acetylmuramic acid kinase [Polaribacter sp. KT 15]SHN00542.1 anhydro-N-acetylmuramic acid kinase [Polaribacter sp. KT 15]